MGGFAGRVESRQLISRQDPTEGRSGFLAGVFIDVATNAPWFDILAEAYLVQRGGKVPVGKLLAEAEVDYLAFAVLPKVRFGFGPLAIFGYAGPHLDSHLRTRAGGELSDVYRQAAATGFGVSIGGGLEVAVGSAGSFRLELRHDEGLSDAFPEASSEVRHRSTGILVRYGRRGAG